LIGRLGKGKVALAKELSVSVSSLYYHKKLPEKDRALKIRIEEAWRYHPSYGHRRLALHLGVNRKRIRRVMKIFDLHPYRRRGKTTQNQPESQKLGILTLSKTSLPSLRGTSGHESGIQQLDEYLNVKAVWIRTA
jgi:hypothetical protein